MAFSQLFMSDSERAQKYRDELNARIYARAGTAPKPKDFWAGLANTALAAGAGLFTGGIGGALAAGASQGAREIAAPENTFNPLEAGIQGYGTGTAVKTLTAPRYDYSREYDQLPTPTQGTPIRPKEAYLEAKQGPDVQETGLFLQGLASNNMGGALSAIGESRQKKEQFQLEARKIENQTLKAVQENDRRLVELAQKESDRNLKPVTVVLSTGTPYTANPAKTITEKIANDKERLRQSAIRIANEINKKKGSGSKQSQISPNKIIALAESQVKQAAAFGETLDLKDALENVRSTLLEKIPEAVPSEFKNKKTPSTNNTKTTKVSSGKEFTYTL